MNYSSQFQNTYRLVSFAMPISASLLVNMISSFIAMLMVARVGKLELAAGALAIPTFLTIMTTIAMIFYAIGILISQARGQQKSSEEIGKIVKSGFLLAIILLIPTVVLLWNIKIVLVFFRQDSQLVALAIPYFHFAALSMFPVLIGAVVSQFFSGMGKPKLMMFVSILSLPLMVLFSYGFILGHFGFPRLGLAGITCSTFLSQTLIYSGIVIFISRANTMKQYSIFSSGFFPDWALCKNIFILGLPIGLQFGGELAAIAISAYLMGFFGVTALAASQIVSQYAILIVMVILGLSQSFSILMSEAYGKQDVNLIKQYINSIFIILLTLFILIFAVFIFCPRLLTQFYVNTTRWANNQDLIALCIQLFAVTSVMLLMDSFRNVLSGGLRGLHDSKAPMRISIFCIWLIALPLSYLIAFNFNVGPVGIRVGFTGGYFIAAVFLWMRLQKKVKLISV